MLAKLCCFSTDSCKGSCLGLSRNQNIKLTYTFILILLLIVSQLKNYLKSAQSITDEDIQEYHCTDIDFNYQSKCVAQKKSTLDFFALALQHLLIFVLLIPKTNHVKVINEGLWLAKVVLLAGLVFLIGNTFGPSISEYVEFGSSLLSPVIYLFINIIVVDNIYFVDFKMNSLSQKHKKLHIIKVVLSILFWALSIFLNVVSYYKNQIWVSVSCSVMIGAFLILTFLRISRNNSLFVYSLVMVHLNYISYSIHSQQKSDDNDIFRGIEHGYRIFILVLSLFGMLAQGGNQIRTKKSTINEILALNTSKKEEDNRYVSSNKWLMYHLVMVLMAFSFAAVFNYECHTTNESARSFLDIGRVSWWVTLIVVYLWSIIVQRIYPQQDFSQLQNYFKEFQLN